MKDPGLIHSYKYQKKTIGICLKIAWFFRDMLSQVRFKSKPRSHGTQWADILDIWNSLWMTAWRRSWDTLLSATVMLQYSSVCHDDVMNLGNRLLFGDGGWPQTGLVFQTLPVWIQHPTSSPYCMKGFPPPPPPPPNVTTKSCGSPWLLNPWARGSGLPHDAWCCPYYQKPKCSKFKYL